MGREVRMVPPDWKHPKNDNHRLGGDYKPLYGRSYAKTAREWMANARAWDDGTHPDAAKHKANCPYWWEWDGGCPDPEDYMPDWPADQCTHFQMYENTSEGTPISPVLATAEELARWLADNEASSFGDMTATYEQWLTLIRRGSSVGSMAMMGDGRVVSGVELAGQASPNRSKDT